MNAVVLDVRANGNTGIARYGHGLLIESQARLENLGGKVYAVVRTRDLPWLRPLFASSSVELVSPPAAEEGRYLRRSIWLENFITDIRPDLFYTTNYAMDQRYPWPFVFTIHDLIRLVLPAASSDEEFIARYGEDEFRRMRRQVASLEPACATSGRVFGSHFEALTRALAAKANRVATVSAATAADIASVLGVPPDRISIVPSAVEEVFHQRGRHAVGRVRGRLSVGSAYFLYVGLAGAHKRVDWLIREFLDAAPHCPRGAQLVIVGGHAEQHADVRHALAEVSWTGQVVLTGRISDNDLASLYTGAAACLSASVKEGFSLPPAEALACGTEAIVTDIPVHREVLGRHAHYFAVDDNARLRQLLVGAANGRLTARAPGFSPPTWEAAADEFVRTIHQALESV